MVRGIEGLWEIKEYPHYEVIPVHCCSYFTWPEVTWPEVTWVTRSHVNGSHLTGMAVTNPRWRPEVTSKPTTTHSTKKRFYTTISELSKTITFPYSYDSAVSVMFDDTVPLMTFMALLAPILRERDTVCLSIYCSLNSRDRWEIFGKPLTKFLDFSEQSITHDYVTLKPISKNCSWSGLSWKIWRKIFVS